MKDVWTRYLLEYSLYWRDQVRPKPSLLPPSCMGLQIFHIACKAALIVQQRNWQCVKNKQSPSLSFSSGVTFIQYYYAGLSIASWSCLAPNLFTCTSKKKKKI